MENQLVNKTYLLQKIAGKGGWTYALIPEIPQNKKAHFGWVRVRGSIDGYEINGYHLMPMGNGTLFLPVKAAIRKKIKKEVGDTVHVILYEDDFPIELPEELISCFKDEPTVYEKFLMLPDAEQKAYVEWIYSAKKEETKVERIVNAISKINNGSKL